MSDAKKGPVLMEVGKTYNLLGLKPEEVVGVVVSKDNANLMDMVNEISTLAKYSSDIRVFNDMAGRVLNNYLTCNISFPNTEIVDVNTLISNNSEDEDKVSE